MAFDISNVNEPISEGVKTAGEGIKSAGDNVEKKTKELHEKYVSKVTPDMGKYGGLSKSAAEMIPGVSSYNAIREGDWTGAAIAAGVDVGSIALGAVTGGVAYGAIKGGTIAAKAGVKVATKEVAEAGARKSIKEGSKKITKEVSETVIERVKTINEELLGKKHPETGVKFILKKFTDDAGVIKEGVVPDFKSKFPDLKLPKSLWKGTHKQHEVEVGRQLKELNENSPKLFKGMNNDQLSQVKNGEIPDGYTIHHDLPNGTIKLVDADIHAKTNHTGGMSLWGKGHN